MKTADYVSNSFDFFGWTPLHAACAGLNFYIIKLLLEHDEDPVTVDKRGNSTFQLMIKWNRIMKDLVADYRVTFRLMMKEAKHKYGNDIGMIFNPTISFQRLKDDSYCFKQLACS